VPPTNRPFPRFIASASQEGRVHGRWEERLREAFGRACEPLAGEAGSRLDPETIRWFPDRTWGGRAYIPITGRATEATTDTEGAEVVVEYYGWVSFEQADTDSEPGELRAKADFTDVTADDNPGWRIDLNDDVIGRWSTDGGRGGDVTIVWGLPMVRGAVAATAELAGETLDQAPVVDGRFSLVAVDAVTGFGDDLYLEVKLWNRGVREVASESLYAETAVDDEEDETD